MKFTQRSSPFWGRHWPTGVQPGGDIHPKEKGDQVRRASKALALLLVQIMMLILRICEQKCSLQQALLISPQFPFFLQYLWAAQEAVYKWPLLVWWPWVSQIQRLGPSPLLSLAFLLRSCPKGVMLSLQPFRQA